MSTRNFVNPKQSDALLSLVEDGMLDASDEALLSDARMKALAREVRDIVEVSVRSARRDRLARQQAPARRQSRRPLPPARRRAAVRELLVADARARNIVGTSRVESMTDEEVEAILARFAALGLLPPDES